MTYVQFSAECCKSTGYVISTAICDKDTWYIVLTKYTKKRSYGMLGAIIRKFAYNYELAIPIRYNQICLTPELEQIGGNSMPWRTQYRR